MNDKHYNQQLSGALKLMMYLSEIVIVNLTFYIFFKQILSPSASALLSTSALYNWMAMTLTTIYLFAIWLRPISFFYRTSRRGSILANVALTTFLMAAMFLTFVVVLHRAHLFPAWRLWGLFGSIFVALLSWRYVALGVIRYLRSRGRNVHHVVFVGGTENLLELYNEMSKPFYGYKVLGYFSELPVADFPEGLVHLGDVKSVIDFMQHHNVQQLYCALPSAMASDIRPIINWCEQNFVRFFSVPNVRNYLKRSMQLEIIGSVPVLCLREDPLSSIGNRAVKRAFDIVVSGAVMVPFWLVVYPVVAIITKLTSPGPVFFKQQRNGLNGRIFYCYKFRSMKVNADADRLQATEQDPRKTRFGDFLRKSSIDELPQFINVLKGDMSIVGPRPHMLKHTEEYSRLIDKYMVRHWVRPGITGWAQVTGARGETRELWQMEERIRKDIWYVENWSLGLDIRIIFMTIWNGIAGDKQAY